MTDGDQNQRDPTDASTDADGDDPDPDAVELYERGDEKFLAEEFEAAIELLNRAIELDPELAPAYFRRGDSLQQSGEIREAIGNYDRAIELDPEYGTAYRNRANAYLKLDEYEKALANYDRAIEINPESKYAYSNRGTVYSIREEYERALADFTRAIEIDPEYAAGYLNLTETQLKLGRPKDAVEDAREIVALSDDVKMVALGLMFTVVAELLARTDDLEELERYREVCAQEFTVRRYLPEVEAWLENVEVDAETEERVREVAGLFREHIPE
jgi:tetratricopeptide (TPR) repeat protein